MRFWMGFELFQSLPRLKTHSRFKLCAARALQHSLDLVAFAAGCETESLRQKYMDLCGQNAFSGDAVPEGAEDDVDENADTRTALL